MFPFCHHVLLMRTRTDGASIAREYTVFYYDAKSILICENPVAWTTYWSSVHSPGYGLVIKYNIGNKRNSDVYSLFINVISSLISLNLKRKWEALAAKTTTKPDMNSYMMLIARRSAGSFLELRLVISIIKF